MRQTLGDFPEAGGLRELKLIKEDPSSYALYKWYKERVTQVCRHRGQLVGCVLGLRPLRDREISADMALYGVFFHTKYITGWRESLAERGHIAYIPALNGLRTAIMGMGSAENEIQPELPELLRLAADDSIEKRSEILQGWMIRDVLTIIAASPEVKGFSSVELVARLIEIPGSPWRRIRSEGALTPRIMAKKLSDLGIRPKAIRLGGKVVKGYLTSDFLRSGLIV